MRVKRTLILLTYFALLAFPKTGNSQSLNEYEVKAVFIYNFTQFVQWPESSFGQPQDPFVIGILGENVFGRYLEEAVAGETYHSHPIVVKYYGALKDAGNCHILYTGTLMNAVKPFIGKPVLTVGDRPDFMEQQGILRFYQEGNKTRIQVNQSAATAAGLVISSKLLRLATIYNGR